MFYRKDVSTQYLSALPVGLDSEVTRVLTIRVPASLHAAIHAQATGAGTSVNGLCVSKIIAEIPQCLVLPSMSGRARAKDRKEKQEAAEL